MNKVNTGKAPAAVRRTVFRSRDPLVEQRNSRNAQKRFFIEACSKGDLEKISLLLRQWVDVDSCDDDGKTALMHAVENGHESAVSLLLNYDADINAATCRGMTALMYAAAAGYERVLRLLLDKKARIDAKDEKGWTALMYASYAGNIDAVECLIEKCASIQTRDLNGMSAADLARHKGFYGILDVITGNSYRRDEVKTAEDKINLYMIDLCRDGSYANIVSALSLGADVNAQNSLGMTGLMWAARKGHFEIAKLLVERNADVNMRDKCGKSALDYAIENNSEEIIALLAEHGAII